MNSKVQNKGKSSTEHLSILSSLALSTSELEVGNANRYVEVQISNLFMDSLGTSWKWKGMLALEGLGRFYPKTHLMFK